MVPMPIRGQIAVGASRIHTILSGGYTHATVEGDAVILAGQSNKGRLVLPIESIVDIDLRRSLLRYRLLIHTSNGEQYLVGSQERDEAIQLDHEIREVASRRQPEVSALVTELASRVDGLLDGARYVRRSEADAFFAEFARGSTAAVALWRRAWHLIFWLSWTGSLGWPSLRRLSASEARSTVSSLNEVSRQCGRQL